MKRSLAFLALALLVGASIAVPLGYRYFTDEAPGAASESRSPVAPGASGPGSLDPLAPGTAGSGGAASGEAGLHNATPKDLNGTPYVPIWDIPAEQIPLLLGEIARFEREEAERHQNRTRDSANSNYSRIRDLLEPLDVATETLLLNDTVENGTSSALKWRTYRLVAAPVRGGFVVEERPTESLWHVERPADEDERSAWVAGTSPLGAQLPRMNDVLESPPIDLSGVEGASGETPEGYRRDPLPSSTAEPVVDEVIPAGTRVPDRQVPYGAGLVNLSYLHRFNFGLLGEDGAVVEVSVLWRNNGTWAPWKPLLHSAADQLQGRQYTIGESPLDVAFPQDPRFSSIPILGTPGYTYTQEWRQDNFDLANYIGETIRLRLRVATRDFGFDTADKEEFPERDFFGWWVDNLTLRAHVRPIDAALTSVLSPKPGDVLVPGSVVNVTALVSNVGGTPLESIRVRLAVNDTIEAEQDVALAPQEARLVTLPWRVPQGTHRLNVSALATLGTEGLFLPTGDTHRANDYRTLTVHGARVTDAELVPGSLVATPLLSEEGTPREIRVVVENVGNLPLENLTAIVDVTDARTGSPAPGRITLQRVGDEERTGFTAAHLGTVPASTRITSLGSPDGRVEVAWSWTPPTPGIYNATVRLVGGNGRDAVAENNLLPRAGERYQVRARATPVSYLGPVTFENASDPLLTIDRIGPTRPGAWRAAVPGSLDPGEGAQLLASELGEVRVTERVAATANIALPDLNEGERLVLTLLTREDGMLLNAPGLDPGVRDEGYIDLYVGSDPGSTSVSPGSILQAIRNGANPQGSESSRRTLAVLENTGAIGWQPRAFNLTAFAGRTAFLAFNHSIPADTGDVERTNATTTWGIDAYRIVRVNATGAVVATVWPPAAQPDNACSVQALPSVGDLPESVSSTSHFPLFEGWACQVASVPAQWGIQSSLPGPGLENNRTLHWVPGLREHLLSPVVDLKNATDPWLVFDQFVDIELEPFRVLFGGRIPYTPYASPNGARAHVEVQAYNETSGSWSNWTKIYPEGGYNAGNYGPRGCLGAPFDDERNGPYDDFTSAQGSPDDNAFQGLNGPWRRVSFNLTSQPLFQKVSSGGLCPKEPERVDYAGKLVRFRFGVTAGGDATIPLVRDGARGWFIDNVAVRERFFANDVGLALETTGTAEPIRVGNGGVEVGQGSSLIVSTKVRNAGRYDQQNVPVTLTIRLAPEDDRGPEDPLHGYRVPTQTNLVPRLRGLLGESEYATVNFSVPWTVPACGPACEGRVFQLIVATDLAATPGKPVRDDDPVNDGGVLTVTTKTRRDLSLTRAEIAPLVSDGEATRAVSFTVTNAGNVDAFDAAGGIRAHLTITRSGSAVPLVSKSLPVAMVNKLAFGRATNALFLISPEETAALPPGVYRGTLRLTFPGDDTPANNEVTLLFRVVTKAGAWDLRPDEPRAWTSAAGWLQRAVGDGGEAAFREESGGRAAEALLESPVLSLGSASRALVRLTHNFSFEAGFDGGILEARVGDNRTGVWGPWVPLTPDGGYPGSLGSGTPAGAVTLPAFTGDSSGAGGRWANHTFEVSGEGLDTRATIFEDTLERAGTLVVRAVTPEGTAVTTATVSLPDLGRTAVGSPVTFTKLPSGRMSLLVTAPGMTPVARTVDLPVDTGVTRDLAIVLEPCATPCAAADDLTGLTGWKIVDTPRMRDAPTGSAMYSGTGFPTAMTFTVTPVDLLANGTLLRFRDWREVEFVGIGPVSAGGNGEDFNDKALVQLGYRDATCIARSVTLESVSANTSTSYEDYYDRSWPLREADLKPYLDQQMLCATPTERADPLTLSFAFKPTIPGLAVNTGWAIAEARLGTLDLFTLFGDSTRATSTWGLVTEIAQGTRWNFYPAEDRDIQGTTQTSREGAFAFTLDSSVLLKGDQYKQFGSVGRNAEGVLESPPIDLSAVVGNPLLTLHHKFQFDNVDRFTVNGGRVEVRYVDYLGEEHVEPLTPLGGYGSTLFGTAYSTEESTLGFPVNATEGVFSGGADGSTKLPGNREGWVTHQFDLTPYKGYSGVQLRFRAFLGGNPNLIPGIESRMSWVLGGLSVESATLQATDLQLRLRALTDATGGSSRWSVDEVRLLTETYVDEVAVRLDPNLDGAALRNGTLPATPFAASAKDRIGYEVVSRGRTPSTVRVELEITYADGTPAERFGETFDLAPGERRAASFPWSPPTPRSFLETTASLRLRAFPVGEDVEEARFRLGDQITANNEERATLRLFPVSPQPLLEVALGEVSAPTTGIASQAPAKVPLRVAARLTGTDPAVANVSLVIRNQTYRHEASAQAVLAWPAGEGFAVYEWAPPAGAHGDYRVYANLTSPAAAEGKAASIGRVFLGVKSLAFADDFEPTTLLDGAWTAKGWTLASVPDAHSGKFVWRSLASTPGLTVALNVLGRTNLDLTGIPAPSLTLSARYAYPERTSQFGARFEIREALGAPDRPWHPLTLATPYNVVFPGASASDFKGLAGVGLLAGRSGGWTSLTADLANQVDVNGLPVSYAGKVVEIRILNVNAGSLPQGTWGIEIDDVRIGSHGLALTPGRQDLAVKDGLTKEFQVKVTNTGAVSDLVNLTADGAGIPAEWSYGFCASTCATLLPRLQVALAPGESHTATLHLQMGLSPFPGVSTPLLTVRGESVGDNNRLLAAPLQFRLAAGRHADLLVAEVVPAKTEVTLGEVVPVAVFVRNQGTAAVDANRVSVRLFDNGRPLDTLVLPVSVLPDPFSLREKWVVASFPWRPLDTGKHQLVAVVNPDNRVEELSLDNNGFNVPLVDVAAAPAPDVSVASVAITPEKPLTGTVAEVTVILRNRGNVEASSVRLEARAGSFLVGLAEDLTLAPGEAKQLVFPWRVISGAEKVTVFAAGDAADANPTDNQAERPLGVRNIAPRVKGPAAPILTDPGQAASFTVQVENAGATAAVLVPDLDIPAGWTARFDATAVGPLASGATASAPLGLTVRPPPDATAGEYLLVLTLGAQGAPEASIELVLPVTVAARHDVQVDVGSAQVSPGELSLVPVTLTNGGNAPETLTLATEPAGLLAPGTPQVVLAPFESRTVQVPLLVPAGAKPGPLGFTLTAASAAADADGDANVEVRRAYTPRIALEGSPEILPGKATTVKLILENAGNAPGTTQVLAAFAAGASEAGLRVSPDLLSVAPGERREVLLSFQAPSGMSAPLLIETLSYEGAPRLDPEATTTVHREAFAVTVSERIPDLRVVSVDQTPKFNVAPGDLLTFTVVVENAGKGDAPESLAGLFLDATLAQEVAIPAIPAGGRATLTLTMPAVAGEHFATVLLDLGSVIPESRKEDNALALKVAAGSASVPGGSFSAATGREAPGAGLVGIVLAAAVAAAGAGALSRRRRAP